MLHFLHCSFLSNYVTHAKVLLFSRHWRCAIWIDFFQLCSETPRKKVASCWLETCLIWDFCFQVSKGFGGSLVSPACQSVQCGLRGLPWEPHGVDKRSGLDTIRQQLIFKNFARALQYWSEHLRRDVFTWLDFPKNSQIIVPIPNSYCGNISKVDVCKNKFQRESGCDCFYFSCLLLWLANLATETETGRWTETDYQDYYWTIPWVLEWATKKYTKIKDSKSFG